MNATYFAQDDTLVLHLSEKPITKAISQDWNTHISYAADGAAVEIVILEAKALRMIPTVVIKAA